MTAAVASLLLVFTFLATDTAARAVNISNVWVLPQEGFPAFYRYFKDTVTWFEADAVCQFHHANLVTVATSKQYDTSRAYLKELDIVDNVWIGLKKKASNEKFLWTDYKVLNDEGSYWQEKIPTSEADLCAVTDPTADFRWHTLMCGGPQVASFICELPVPPWAKKADGCLLTALPSLTVTYLPEQATVELTSDCGLDGTRRIACKGQADHSEMVRQLSCENSSNSDEEEKPVSVSSTTLDGAEAHQSPTRHRREADNATTRTATETTAANDQSHETSPATVAGFPVTSSATKAPDATTTESQYLGTRSQETVLVTDKTTSAQSMQTSTTATPHVNVKPSPYFTTGIQETISATANTTSAKLEFAVTETKQVTNVDKEATQAEILQTQTPLSYMNVTTSRSIFSSTTDEVTTDIVNSTKPPNDEANATKNTPESRRRQLLPTPLRDVPTEDETETSDVESSSQHYDNSQLLALDADVPAKPNRGRRLTRPQGHSFYPYFLNRVLG